MNEDKEQLDSFHAKKEAELPKYETPKVVTFSEDELLSKLGPAQACSPFGGAVFGC